MDCMMECLCRLRQRAAGGNGASVGSDSLCHLKCVCHHAAVMPPPSGVLCLLPHRAICMLKTVNGTSHALLRCLKNSVHCENIITRMRALILTSLNLVDQSSGDDHFSTILKAAANCKYLHESRQTANN